MIWSIWANEFQDLPEIIKAKMWAYLSNHGCNPERMRGFTFDGNAGAIWVEYVEVNAVNLAYADDYRNTGGVMEPYTTSEWIRLEDPNGKDRPNFLEWMTPGEEPPAALGEAGKNRDRPFVVLKDSEWGTGRDGY
jgi:hypothetical protein